MLLDNYILTTAFSLLFINITHGCSDDSCKRQEFPEIPDVGFSGQYLVYKGPWPHKNCLRLCRQYMECVAFIMEWVGAEKHFGYCGLVRPNSGPNLLGPPAIAGQSLFGKCFEPR
jgi:hypothetical protein